ncbi:putative ABC-type ATPase [Pseudoduganella flava]|uniref:AAA family ATPase n=1 Tax=Pseudoduganella flava TaxID=871742 RepID=A0A562Q1Q2_9BURK|nr:zeta toxin family protein [Pseudoduganella flava]QGZ38107.1 AAA family ATPase [Pseudoduganella flava]TWI50380.1 putative ABC-type ATPase [Pseudoduganella flava]
MITPSRGASNVARQALPQADKAVRAVLKNAAEKPFAIVLAGHNGSGKSTFWYEHVAEDLQIPLINADRLMLSILPEAGADGKLRPWAQQLRDKDTSWMAVAQQGVQGFIAQAISQKVPFAFETVFSYWKKLPNGRHASKIDIIRDLQKAGYFVLLIFVGLTSAELSIGRVMTRVFKGGHDVDEEKLRERYPRTQQAINKAILVSDAAILLDNSRTENLAFTPVHIRRKRTVDFDIRAVPAALRIPKEITTWLDVVAPRN